MMTSIINYFYQEPLLSIIIVCFFLSRFIIAYKYHRYGQITIEDTEASADNFIKYLDKYYIINISKTALSVIFYFSMHFSLILYLHFRILTEETFNKTMSPIELDLLDINYSALFKILPHILIFILSFISFKMLLDLLFFDQVLRLHIYLQSMILYRNLTDYLHSHHLQEFFGAIYLFLYNITKLRPMSELDNSNDYYDFNLHDTIYENKNIQKLSFFFVSLAKRYKIFLWVFIFLKNIFRWFYRHMYFYNFFPYLFNIIFFGIIFYDFIHLKIYYTFYALIPFYIIHIFMKFVNFIKRKSLLNDVELWKYFYKNSLDYAKQRELLAEDIHQYVKILFYSQENGNIFTSIKNKTLVQYILNNFQYDISKESKITEKHLQALYFRFFLIGSLSLMYIYLFLKLNIFISSAFLIDARISLIYILLFLFIFTIYTSNNIFVSQDPEGKYDNTYKYSHYYKVLFWCLILFQAYILWIIIVKTTIFVITTEVLWEYRGIKIIKYYTIDDKIKYFYDYLELYIKLHCFDGNALALFKSYMEEINIKDFIDENISIETLKNFIEDLSIRYNIVKNVKENT